MLKNSKNTNNKYKLKLLFVATTVYSTNSALSAHLNALSDDFDVTLCTNLKTGVLTKEIGSNINIIHIDIERKIEIFKDIRALFQIFRILKKLSPDAVHSVTPKAGLLLMLAANFAGLPYRFHTFTGQVWTNHSGFRRRFLILFDKIIAGLATQVFADGLTQCDFLASENVVSRLKISVLGGGSIAGVDIKKFNKNSDIRRFLRLKHNTPDGYFIFLFVGRLVFDKGIVDLIEAFNLVSKQKSDIALWLVGPDEEFVEKKISAKYYISDEVKFIGSYSDPQDYMAASDTLVLPSYREGFSTVIIEAAASMLPTIGYDINGIKDPIVNNKTGLLVNKGDVRGLASAMFELCGNLAKTQAMGQHARYRTVTLYSQDRITAAWKDFYRQVFSDNFK